MTPYQHYQNLYQERSRLIRTRNVLKYDRSKWREYEETNQKIKALTEELKRLAEVKT